MPAEAGVPTASFLIDAIAMSQAIVTKLLTHFYAKFAWFRGGRMRSAFYRSITTSIFHFVL